MKFHVNNQQLFLVQVVDEHIVQTLPDKTNPKTHIVKAAWFWFTIQNGYAYENEYQFSDVSVDIFQILLQRQ